MNCDFAMGIFECYTLINSEQVAQLRFDRAEHFDSHQGNQTEIRKHKDRS